MSYKKAMELHIGAEPAEGAALESRDMLSTFNHYSHFYGLRDAVEFLSVYMETVDPTFMARHDCMRMAPTIGWIARLKTRNVSLPAETEAWFVKNLAKIPVKVKVDQPVYASIRDSLESVVFGEIDERFDRGDTDSFDFLKEYNLPFGLMKKIINRYGAELKELLNIESDPDLKEGYAHFTDEQIDAKVAELKRLLSVLGVTDKIDSPIRRGRKAKVKTPEEWSKWMVIQESCPELNLKSLPAVKAYGKRTAVYYIPKHRTIQIFNAEEGKILEIRGKSLINFDPANSFAKSVRKPEESIGNFVVNTNTKKLMAAFNNLSTKARSQTTALISPNHMLIAAF